MFKSLLILKKNEANIINNKYCFNFKAGIRIKSFIIKKIYNSIMSNIIYLHIPQLMNHTINPTKQGDGRLSDIVAVLDSSSSFDLDRHTICLNEEKQFQQFTVYFTNNQGNIITLSEDFVIVMDITKNP